MKRPRTPRACLPPPGLRRRIPPDLLRKLCLCHEVNVKDIRQGKADQQCLFDHLQSTLCWLTLARDYQARYGTLAETVRVLEAAWAACGALRERWRRTGRVVFAGPELTMAQEAIPHMDAVAELVDWADAQVATAAATRALRELDPALEIVEA